jgi:hypothetical protein
MADSVSTPPMHSHRHESSWIAPRCMPPRALVHSLIGMHRSDGSQCGTTKPQLPIYTDSVWSLGTCVLLRAVPNRPPAPLPLPPPQIVQCTLHLLHCAPSDPQYRFAAAMSRTVLFLWYHHRVAAAAGLLQSPLVDVHRSMFMMMTTLLLLLRCAIQSRPT